LNAARDEYDALKSDLQELYREWESLSESLSS
jgi:hypothetical protein